MHYCEFCSTPFTPRPQTKNPRACNKDSCQKARQKANQKEWRECNRDCYNKRDHYNYRANRNKLIQEIISFFVEALTIGAHFKNYQINFELIKPHIHKFLFQVGIREIKKLWSNLDLLLSGV